jgi:hypothetical protein
MFSGLTLTIATSDRSDAEVSIEGSGDRLSLHQLIEARSRDHPEA